MEIKFKSFFSIQSGKLQKFYKTGIDFYDTFFYYDFISKYHVYVFTYDMERGSMKWV